MKVLKIWAKGLRIKDFPASGAPMMRMLISFMRPSRNARSTAMRNESGLMSWSSMRRFAAGIHLPPQVQAVDAMALRRAARRSLLRFRWQAVELPQPGDELVTTLRAKTEDRVEEQWLIRLPLPREGE